MIKSFLVIFMSELLAPAGSFEALVAAISNGADAIYLGMNKFGARAYASNFDLEQLNKAIEYAHLRNVKIYVTMNTIIFEEELGDMKALVDQLYLANVDGLIIQDLAVLEYVVTNYPQMEAHCSTQMGIDDLEGTLLLKELGAKRVVLSREVEIEKVKEIKKIAKIPLEIFVHGALCVSYSGNCLMSGLIGYRSGNRGRCVGSCRKPYQLIDVTNNITYPKNYILSMKDLNTLDNIKDLMIADSLKIEGRMKEPAYVANIVKTYRTKLDNPNLDTKELQENLTKTFQRTFTKGYLFHEDKKDITNIEKPNNYGYLIGEIISKNKNGYQIKLSKQLNQGDIIRIDHNGQEINLTAAKIYDNNGNLINSSSTVCFIQIKEALSKGDKIYKTKDIKFYNEIEKTFPKEFKRFEIDLNVIAYPNQPLMIYYTCDGIESYYESEDSLQEAIKEATSIEAITKQLNRLNDTVYKLGIVETSIGNVFIPVSKLNEARRFIVDNLNKKRNTKRIPLTITKKEKQSITFPAKDPVLAVFANTQEQYEAAKECGIEIIYYKDNVIRRNEVKYPKKDIPLLIGGYGGIYAYKDKTIINTDFSLNVVNSESVYKLHSLGVNRVTLSHEINKKQIEDLISNYYKENNGYPNLEMIVYGRADLLFTRYCPLKKMNLCGKCKQNKYVIQDEYGSFPIISHSDCTTTLLNGKILNLIDELETINNIQTFRIQLTLENKEESINIINQFKDKLKNKNKTHFFNKDTDTRGHFNKELL